MSNDQPAARAPIDYADYLAIKAVWEAENAHLVEVLRNMEYAVNRSVSGMKVDIGEWLKLIQAAREVLGDRVMDTAADTPAGARE